MNHYRKNRGKHGLEIAANTKTKQHNIAEKYKTGGLNSGSICKKTARNKTFVESIEKKTKPKEH